MMILINSPIWVVFNFMSGSNELEQFKFIGHVRELSGQIKKQYFRVGGRPRFRVLIDDDQFISEPTLFLKPRAVVLSLAPGGLIIVSRRCGLATIPYDIIEPGRYVPVIQPIRPDRNPYIPLESILRTTATK